MTMSQILSYIGGTSQPVLTSQNNGPDFFDLIQSLQCGDTVISIFPSVIYLIGIALLIHHIITMNIRPQLYRRVGRELLLQIPWQVRVVNYLINYRKLTDRFSLFTRVTLNGIDTTILVLLLFIIIFTIFISGNFNIYVNIPMHQDLVVHFGFTQHNI